MTIQSGVSTVMLFQPPVFETIFRIPVEHRLVIRGSRSRGAPLDGVRWYHDEFDAAGILVARYETYDETDEAGQGRCGWRRYDAAGRLVARHEVAMRWSALVALKQSRRGAEMALQRVAASTPPSRRSSAGSWRPAIVPAA
ncbi:hypothetical protein [Methylobacterium aquaticum]|nr:hypothetical protein [Methylobacterium aquaticum]